MAKIKAFQALRPNEKIADRVAALPYDVCSRSEAKKEIQREPLSFLKIDRAETQFEDTVDMYAKEVYQRAHDSLWDMVSGGSFIKDDKKCLYLYELTMNGRIQTGLVACSSVEDYLNDVIKKHENTLDSKLQDRIRHVDVCNAQTGPIFLAYRKNPKIAEYLIEAKENAPIFDFVSSDGIGHRGWKIEADEQIQKITEAFDGIDHTYIADGHHRAESAVRVSLKRKAEWDKKAEDKADEKLERESDYFLSVLFSEEELYIMDYNRIVKDLNGLTEAAFLSVVANICDITLEATYQNLECEGHPAEKGHMRMYLAGRWYDLSIKEEYRSNDPVDGLDVSILQNEILQPILGIENPKTDSRIQFVGGIRGLKEIERRADAVGGVAFVMYPTAMQELFQVADAGKLMPPKSTWFEPKLRSGLFIHVLD